MSFQDSYADHLQDSVRQKRRRACEIVAEAWNFLEDGMTASSKIIPLLAEAVELIRPRDVRGQMLLPVSKAVAEPAPQPEPAPPAPKPPKPLHPWGRPARAVYCRNREGQKFSFDSIKEAKDAMRETYASIVQSIDREHFTNRGLRWRWKKTARKGLGPGKEVNLEEATDARIKANI